MDDEPDDDREAGVVRELDALARPRNQRKQTFAATLVTPKGSPASCGGTG
jgi:hypothetical protein